ncbi:MAG TPA: endonuclease/exonuclease/phosphatase family protein [Candidatus Binatia bacterium]
MLLRSLRTGRGATSFLFALALVACSDAPRSAAPDVTLVSLNFLHGIFCPPDTDRCRLPDRTKLLFDFIAARGCPDLVTLQEIWPPSVEQMEPYLATTCPFPYELVQGARLTGVDDETVLTRYPVLLVEQLTLYRQFRRVLWTRIAHPAGTLDLYSTHLASSADGAREPCADDCPPECVAAGATNVRDCQAVQMAQFIERTHDAALLGLVAGDFNERPGSFVYEQFVGRGWSDVYLAAGNPECDPATGVGCTSGRADEGLAGLESPELGVTSRIDFVFLIRPAERATCAAEILPPADDGSGTRLFADVPNPFASTCGPLPAQICWPSDHVGVQLALACG